MIVAASSSASAEMKLQRWWQQQQQKQHITSHTPYRTRTHIQYGGTTHTKLFIFKIVKFVHVKIEESLLFCARCYFGGGCCCFCCCCETKIFAACWDHDKKNEKKKLATDCDSWSISTKNLVVQIHKSTAFTQSYCCLYPLGF